MVATTLLASGCSSFRKDARTARAATPPEGSPEGLYEGKWYKSKRPDHGGKQELVLSQTGYTLYRASTRSQWWRIFHSSYDTTVVLTPVKPGEYIIQGGKGIWAVGTYTIAGRVDPVSLKAEYAAGKHLGKLELQRVGATAAETPEATEAPSSAVEAKEVTP